MPKWEYLFHVQIDKYWWGDRECFVPGIQDYELIVVDDGLQMLQKKNSKDTEIRLSTLIRIIRCEWREKHWHKPISGRMVGLFLDSDDEWKADFSPGKWREH